METIKEALCRNRNRGSGSPLRDSLLFLDYGGVIDIDPYSSIIDSFDPMCVANVSELCKDFSLKIVVTSSLKNDPDYISALYDCGLDKSVAVLGKTRNLGDREEEIIDFVSSHQVFIDRFIIIDDARLDGLASYQVRTDRRKGFTREKREEAEFLLNDQEKNRGE